MPGKFIASILCLTDFQSKRTDAHTFYFRGGNYFTMGGSVKGGQIHGEYPSDITLASPLNIGRGRLIPTMSWESIFNSVLQWMDVPDSQLDYCLPNRFDAGAQLLTKAEVFEDSV